jgi:hypothetical protein
VRRTCTVSRGADLAQVRRTADTPTHLTFTDSRFHRRCRDRSQAPRPALQACV